MKPVFWPNNSPIFVYEGDTHKIVAPKDGFYCDNLEELFEEIERVYRTCKPFPNKMRRVPVKEL